MKLPVIEGIIRRRILVNYRVDPQALRPLLPPQFSPKLHEGQAVAGICLIRLEQIRPKGLPEITGLASENAAHRIAVQWEEQGSIREGVFIPRRDTDSRLNHVLGGRVFSGEHHLATFNVDESESRIDFHMRSNDGEVSVDVSGQVTQALPETSIFKSLAAASSFFEAGSVGYSARSHSERLDGIELATSEWHVEPLGTEEVYSSFFADARRFPKGSVEFDHTLIMRNINHEWRTID